MSPQREYEDADQARWLKPSGLVRLGTWGSGLRPVDVRSTQQLLARGTPFDASDSIKSSVRRFRSSGEVLAVTVFDLPFQGARLFSTRLSASFSPFSLGHRTTASANGLFDPTTSPDSYDCGDFEDPAGLDGDDDGQACE